ncbi:hypothetical protein BL250_00815 [Erwinia sp. OLTSP20]|nr:hypothetical protein BK416_14580 [Erwinia sp. OLSSP12]PIJ79180.1 hypothetical protein BLD47_14885 [Erwinia sp. OLCASP19]PIJ80706.1 hypothetical protein BLD46_14045 [Erwinia sp. OLMTSP26]PIJ82856.1 hypothetical protein BLD49_13940 [Erwinia sp. OLMDSP33]PIJ91710.1 hypothetical protein BL249_07750 [Erwinia sp. OLFS4]PIJ95316.1 hypothetical protein BL250_00815 [Erwinia sp. OLTSP20]
MRQTRADAAFTRDVAKLTFIKNKFKINMLNKIKSSGASIISDNISAFIRLDITTGCRTVGDNLISVRLIIVTKIAKSAKGHQIR